MGRTTRGSGGRRRSRTARGRRQRSPAAARGDGKEGINRWCRVVKSASEAAKVEKETAAVLKECGCEVDTAVGDANDWDEDDDEYM